MVTICAHPTEVSQQLELAQLKDELQRYLMIFEPSELLPQMIGSTRDIYENRSILKRLPCADSTVRHLAQIVLVEIEGGKRFRKTECLKVLRAIVRNSAEAPQFQPETVRLLFRIYQKLIFKVSEEGQWAASVLIKNQLLADGEIQWLIDNYDQSVHLLNRLLLYPVRHPAIVTWAENVYRTGELPGRRTEVIALLIQDDIPSFVDQTHAEPLLRAVSRARISHEHKEALLRTFAVQKSYDTLLDLALRLEMPSLIRHMIAEITKDGGG